MLTVRLMRLADVAAAGKLANRVFRRVVPARAFAFAQNLTRPEAVDFFGPKCSVEYFVACLDGKIVGTSGLYHDDDETAWLGWFCVDASHRGCGIGGRLFRFSEIRARQQGFRALKLWTGQRDKVAHRLYRRHGMRLVRGGIVGTLIFRKKLR